MKNRDELLPLFPLGVVLFPNSALPLHIFETRYKLLINNCAEEKSEFGINLVEKESLSIVGCTAVVREVVRRYDDGKLDVIVEGKDRYTLLEFYEDRAPYLVGKIEYRSRTKEKADRSLLEETVHLHNKLMSVVYKDEKFIVPRGKGGHEVSFHLARKVGLDLRGRQSLLELDSENERLNWLHKYLKELLPKVENAAAIDWIVRQDGYL